MSFFRFVLLALFVGAFTLGVPGRDAQALDLDWQGSFRGETNMIFGATHKETGAAAGYKIPNNNDSPAAFQNLFLNLKPRVLVNDNVSIQSDLWFNSPDRGLFGSNTPTTPSSSYSQVQSGTGSVSARTFFAEVATDFGTFRMGRVPLHYGLGLVWNSGDSLDNRFPSNGDAISFSTKFGSFRVTPSFVKYQQAATSFGAFQPSSGISDYSLNVSYANDDEQLEFGLLFLRRLAGESSGVVNPFFASAFGNTAGTAGYVYNLWDFYVKKKAGIFTFAAEVPLASGLVASRTYSSMAGVVNASAAVSDRWTLKLNAGSANGQANGSTATTGADRLTAFAFHPDYRPGLILFNYNLQNLSTGSGSYYQQPITNARFLAFSGEYSSGKFSQEVLALFAFADQAADGTNAFFNTQLGRYETATASTAQEKNLGFEVDYGIGYDWDEFTRFGVDVGLYFPGAYYNFSNNGGPNSRGAVFGSRLSMMVRF